MNGQDLVNKTIYDIYSHYKVFDMPSAQERLAWSQLFERYNLNANDVFNIRLEMFDRYPEAQEKEIFKLFMRVLQAQQPEHLAKEKESKKTTCAYCRDRGYASVYSKKDINETESVICFCAQGNFVLEKLSSDNKQVLIASAGRDRDVRNRVLLFHRHHQERADAWAQKHGSKDSTQPSVIDTFMMMFQKMKGGVLQKVDRLPEYLDPQVQARYFYENGDERGELR